LAVALQHGSLAALVLRRWLGAVVMAAAASWQQCSGSSGRAVAAVAAARQRGCGSLVVELAVGSGCDSAAAAAWLGDGGGGSG
jgi:hypothetical protein